MYIKYSSHQYLMAESPETKGQSVANSLRISFENSKTFFLGSTQFVKQINSILLPLVEGYVEFLMKRTTYDIEDMPTNSLQQLSALVHDLLGGKYINDQPMTDVTVKKNYENLRHALGVSVGLPKFLREMSFVYLIARFEDFISKELKNIFIKKDEVLRTTAKDRKVSYQEVFDAPNLESLKDKIIEREVTRILMQDLERINGDLKHFLHTDLTSNESNWKAIQECFQRRHILIHNNGRVNSTYRQKTGYTGMVEHLSVDESYLSKSIRLFETYCNYITNQVITEFCNVKNT
jgi:hypothetical protein